MPNNLGDNDEQTRGENWSEVSFENLDYHVISGSRIRTQYLYADGTSDGGSRADWFDKWKSFTQATRDYCRIDPKCIGVRDPEFAERAGAAMWVGAAIYNGYAGTYNLGAWGANQWTPSKDFVPYAPILSPDENTSDAGKFIYCGTNTALLIQGGVNGIRSLRNLWSAANTGASAQNSTALITREIRLTSHAVEQMTERPITKSMIESGLRNGEKVFDPKTKTINYVIRNGFVRGKDLLVGTNPFNGQVTTVIRGTNLVKARFIPIQR